MKILLHFDALANWAIGIDGLNPRFFEILLSKLLPYVTHVFNTILTKSTFPDEWKESKITPIPKQNNEFRPISILPFLSKVIENIMSEQINEYVRSHNILCATQSGFIKGNSCMTALTDVVVLRDHSKVFDTVDHSILLKKLGKLFYFSETACRLLRSYLTGRSQIVSYNGTCSESLDVDRGDPQGSVLGPLLFCLYINDLPDTLEHCKIHMYADDVQIYNSGSLNGISACINNINSDLRKIDIWARNNGLCINPTKSKCILTDRSNRNITNDIEIKISCK